jgi:hypothetical protein
MNDASNERHFKMNDTSSDTDSTPMVVIKRSPSQTDEEVEDNPPPEVDLEASISGLESSSSFMLLPLPLNLQSLETKTKDSASRPITDQSPRSKTRQTVSPASSSSTSGSRPHCMINLLPSPMPSVDLMTALATLKAEFIQNYIVAMINRKVSSSVLSESENLNLKSEKE